jgi:hypothetical protein
MTFKIPTHSLRDGQTRRVGIELEYAGLKLDDAAQLVIEAVGGEQHPINRFSQKVLNTSLGDFRLELDVVALQNESYESYLRELGLDIERLSIKNEVETFLERITTFFLPYELVAPPVPFDQLEQIEELRRRFYENKAKGTNSSVTYAFGLHFNVETPEDTVESWLGYLRAFLLLYPWLHKRSNIDLTRRVTPFIDRFPQAYVHRVLDRSYRPTKQEFMEDYVAHNPTRNRPLDYFSIFADQFGRDHPLVRDVELVKPRPTFHYRLPNCEIDNPDWRLAREWNLWVAVEELAADPERLESWRKAYLNQSQDTWLGFHEKWTQWLDERLPDPKSLA